MSDKNGKTARAESVETQGKATDLVPTELQQPSAPEREAPDGLRGLALEHPFALVAGGIVAGVVIGALLPRANTGRLARNLGALAGVVGELGLAYARKAVDGVGDAASSAADTGSKVAERVGNKAGDIIDAVGETAHTYSGRAAETAESAVANLRNSAEGLARQVIRLTSHLRH